MDGFVSPRLGIRFEVGNGELQVFGPDGREWALPDEIARQRDEAEARIARLEARLRELGADPGA